MELITEAPPRETADGQMTSGFKLYRTDNGLFKINPNDGGFVRLDAVEISMINLAVSQVDAGHKVEL